MLFPILIRHQHFSNLRMTEAWSKRRFLSAVILTLKLLKRLIIIQIFPVKHTYTIS